MELIFPNDVKGWLSPGEGELLFKLAQKEPHLGVIVELGSYHGRSTICLAQGSKKVKGRKIFTVDNFKGDSCFGPQKNFYKTLSNNIRRYRLDQYVSIIKGDAARAAYNWHKPIRLLFIDTDHHYEGVSRDFVAWEKYIAPKGLVVFHDSLEWPEVSKFICELIRAGGFKNFRTLSGSGTAGITYASKKSQTERIPWVEKARCLFTFETVWVSQKLRYLNNWEFWKLLFRRFLIRQPAKHQNGTWPVDC